MPRLAENSGVITNNLGASTRVPLYAQQSIKSTQTVNSSWRPTAMTERASSNHSPGFVATIKFHAFPHSRIVGQRRIRRVHYSYNRFNMIYEWTCPPHQPDRSLVANTISQSHSAERAIKDTANGRVHETKCWLLSRHEIDLIGIMIGTHAEGARARLCLNAFVDVVREWEQKNASIPNSIYGMGDE